VVSACPCPGHLKSHPDPSQQVAAHHQFKTNLAQLRCPLHALTLHSRTTPQASQKLTQPVSLGIIPKSNSSAEVRHRADNRAAFFSQQTTLLRSNDAILHVHARESCTSPAPQSITPTVTNQIDCVNHTAPNPCVSSRRWPDSNASNVIGAITAP